jgi:hypothetical protein
MASICWLLRELYGRAIAYRHFRRSAPARIVGSGGIAGGIAGRGGASDRQFSADLVASSLSASWARHLRRWRTPRLCQETYLPIELRTLLAACSGDAFGVSLELGSSVSAVAAAA